MHYNYLLYLSLGQISGLMCFKNVFSVSKFIKTLIHTPSTWSVQIIGKLFFRVRCFRRANNEGCWKCQHANCDNYLTGVIVLYELCGA